MPGHPTPQPIPVNARKYFCVLVTSLLSGWKPIMEEYLDEAGVLVDFPAQDERAFKTLKPKKQKKRKKNRPPPPPVKPVPTHPILSDLYARTMPEERSQRCVVFRPETFPPDNILRVRALGCRRVAGRLHCLCLTLVRAAVLSRQSAMGARCIDPRGDDCACTSQRYPRRLHIAGV